MRRHLLPFVAIFVSGIGIGCGMRGLLAQSLEPGDTMQAPAPRQLDPLALLMLPQQVPDCLLPSARPMSRVFLRTDIAKGFVNRTPPPMPCQIVERAMPEVAAPSGRVPMAIWFVDVDSHDGVKGVVVDMDSTRKSSPAGGLLTFTPLAWDDMQLTTLSVPSGYQRMSPLLVPAGVKSKPKDQNQIRDLGVLIVVEMSKR